MAKHLTILMAPINTVGHVNACIGLAQVLQSRGHNIVFVTDQAFAGQVLPYGFIEEIIGSQNNQVEQPGEMVAKYFLNSGLLLDISSYESTKIIQNMNFINVLIDEKKANELSFKLIVDKYNPHLFIIDDIFPSPTIVHSYKPWVSLISFNPLSAINHHLTPPYGSGYSTNGDQNEWKKFKEMFDNGCKKMFLPYNQWMTELGLPINDTYNYIESPFLNIYGYPKELDYTDIRPIPPKWLQIDAFIRKSEQHFQLPDKLLNRNKTKSKLIYLSMGSMGSIDVNLMKKFVSILSKSNHMFIVSKGFLGDTYELSDNMWGQNSVPQTRVLPLVDVVITHGGNNSVTEAFTYGKPMIVMPLWGDQFDNAQRVHDKRFGLRLNPYKFLGQELLDSIEKLLNDKEMKARLLMASQRMVNSDSIQKAAQIIENLSLGFTLSFCTYELALNPKTQQKLYEELIEAIDPNNGDIAYEDLAKLAYLDSVVSETLRLHPTTQRFNRIALVEYELGSTDNYPNPFQYDPDRFMPQSRHKLKPYTYLPFGAGPRNCIAMRFAILVVELALAHIITKYRFYPTPNTDDPVRHIRAINVTVSYRIILGTDKSKHVWM